MKIFAFSISIASTFALPITTNGLATNGLDAFSANYLEKIPGALEDNMQYYINQNIGQNNISPFGVQTWSPNGYLSRFQFRNGRQTFSEYLSPHEVEYLKPNTSD